MVIIIVTSEVIFMSQLKEDIKEIEEEILDEEGKASLGTRFNLFRRKFGQHAELVIAFLAIIILNGFVQTGLLIAILIWVQRL